MSGSHTGAEDSHQAIGEIVELLRLASQQTWQDVAPASPRVSLGLGIYLAQAQASSWLPPGRQVPVAVRDGRTVVQLLRDAEHRTRQLSLHEPAVAGVSHLLVALCDLIGEASHLDC